MPKLCSCRGSINFHSYLTCFPIVYNLQTLKNFTFTNFSDILVLAYQLKRIFPIFFKITILMGYSFAVFIFAPNKCFYRF